jgi:hypothetical protein
MDLRCNAPDGDPPRYRDGTAAGHKGNSKHARETGRAAAKEVTRSLGRRHKQMLNAWAPYGANGARPEEVARDLGLPVHVVRPRASELVKRKLLFEVGKRPGDLGSLVMAYATIAPAEPLAEAA